MNIALRIPRPTGRILTDDSRTTSARALFPRRGDAQRALPVVAASSVTLTHVPSNDITACGLSSEGPRKRLAHFNLLALLGWGGSAAVHLGHDTRFDRAVAIKVVHPHLDVAVHSALLEAEGRRLARLAHPGIVNVHSMGRDGARAYLVLEYVEGQTLEELLAAGLPPLAEAARIGARLAEVVAAVHRRGVVHRDLKPANVIRSRDGTVRLFDFGLARNVHDPVCDDSGTPAYMAPEQWLGHRNCAATDAWALGLVLAELFHGALPWGEPPVSLAHHERLSWRRRRALDLQGVPNVCPHAPEVAALIARCLHRDPSQRPTANAIAATLRAVAAQAPSRVDEATNAPTAPQDGRTLSLRRIFPPVMLASLVCAWLVVCVTVIVRHVSP